MSANNEGAIRGRTRSFTKRSTRSLTFFPGVSRLFVDRNVRLAAFAFLSILLILSTSSLPSIPSPVAAKEKPKYNVLFIISDDLRPELGSYGNTIIKTPNIDKLAARGVRFDHAYAQYPLCNPSRSSLLTGRYPTQTGVMDNNIYFRVAHPNWVTLPQHFKNNGYATLRTGKIFHGGIDDMVSWTEGGEPTNPAITGRGSDRPGTAASPAEIGTDPDEVEGLASAMPRPPGVSAKAAASDRIIMLEGNGEKHGDYKTATRAIQYLEKYKDQPFFLAVGFVKPHSPPTAPKKFFDMYDPAKIPLPPDFAARPAAPPGFPQLSISPRNADLFIGRDASPEAAREMIRAYWASTSFMDEQVGRVLDALERLHLQENTIVVFWGDHGYHLGEKGKWSKAYSLYEVGLRVPLIFVVPGVTQTVSLRPSPTNSPASPNGSLGISPRVNATVIERPVQLLDMYPTLAELCGLSRPAQNEGHSLVSLLRNPSAPWNYPAYSVTAYQSHLGKSVRTERWHYVQWDDGKSGEMLLDQSNDPHELKNLATDPAYAKTVREMRALLSRMPAK